MNVQAVADQLHAGSGVHGRSHQSGLPVVKPGHGVEHMSYVAGPAEKSLHGLLVSALRMPQRDHGLL